DGKSQALKKMPFQVQQEGALATIRNREPGLRRCVVILRKIKIGIFVFSLISAQQARAATEVSTCSVLNAPGEYVLVNDLPGAPGGFGCMIITAASVKLDCNGFRITNSGPPVSGSGTIGILANGPIADVTVQNCAEISQYEVGARFYKTDNSSFKNND